MTVLAAVKSGIIHPVPLPIIVGLLFAQTGLVLPEVVDKPLHLLGTAFGPVALVLVGVTLTQVQVGQHLKSALGISLLKNLALPSLVAALGLGLGMSGLPLTVMIVAASLPIGRQRVFVCPALRGGARPGDRQHGGVHGAGSGHHHAGDVAGGAAGMSESLRPRRS